MAQPRSVVVVSPDLEAQGRVRDLLAAQGTTVVALPSLQDATAAVGEVRPLFVLLWPGISAGDLRSSARILKAYAHDAGAPVLMAGPDSLQCLEEAVACGVDEYLPEGLVSTALPRRVEALHHPTLRRDPPLRPRTVLIADPDAFWRMRVGDLLEAAGYHVLYAGHRLELDEALGGARGPVPEICVMDPFASGLEGLDTLRALRATPAGRELPVLVVSAAVREPAMLEALRGLDVHDLIEKSSLAYEAVVPLIRDLAPSQLRRTPRVSVLALCRLRAEGEERWDSGLVYNLSSTGAFVRTLAPLPEGTRLEVLLDLALHGAAPRELVRVTAQVAWAQAFQPSVAGRPSPGLGLRFETLPDAERIQLEAWLWPTTARPDATNGEKPPSREYPVA